MATSTTPLLPPRPPNASSHLKTGPTVIVSGEGVRVRDSKGREHIDDMAGLWCVNVGWGRTEIADAKASVPAQMGGLVGATAEASPRRWPRGTATTSRSAR